MGLSGMTGFARTEGALGAWTWAVEARSVNGRGLEVRFRGPPGFDSLERGARAAAQARFARGQITVGLQAKRAESQGRLRINTEELDQLIKTARTYVDRGGVTAPRFDGLLSLRGVMDAGAEDEDDGEAHAAVEAAMDASLALALDGLKAARDQEGAALTGVLMGLVDQIAALARDAESHAAAQPRVLKDRFEARIAELLADRSGLEERIVQEAALMAAKADVREELDRLTVHVDAARALLASDGAVGRKLDFLTQEFMREANTLCSKSAVSALTARGLDLKAVIEQFREQVQNVE
jgi:uncharacterized protein (TIGR00255 family)